MTCRENASLLPEGCVELLNVTRAILRVFPYPPQCVGTATDLRRDLQQCFDAEWSKMERRASGGRSRAYFPLPQNGTEASGTTYPAFRATRTTLSTTTVVDQCNANLIRRDRRIYLRVWPRSMDA